MLPNVGKRRQCKAPLWTWPLPPPIGIVPCFAGEFIEEARLVIIVAVIRYTCKWLELQIHLERGGRLLCNVVTNQTGGEDHHWTSTRKQHWEGKIPPKLACGSQWRHWCNIQAVKNIPFRT
jgi:hypothetical protein